MHTLEPRSLIARTAAALCGAALALGAVPSAASAEPNAFAARLLGDNDYLVPDICAFPVVVAAHQRGTFSVRETPNGTLVSFSIVETDVYSANGRSLTSDQYAFRYDLVIDPDGNLVDADYSGLLVKVPLPDGSTFFGAGRTDLLQVTSGFVAVPDVGTSRGLDGFCAALT